MSDHHHDHHHGHAEPGQGEMPVSEKLKKMVQHWRKHNADHADTYRQWAQRARQAGMADVADILESVAEESQAVDGGLERAGRMLTEKY